MAVRTIPPVALIGASCRWMAASLQRAGIACFVADLFCDADLPNTCHYLKINGLHAAENIIPNSIPMIFGGGFETHPSLVSSLLRKHHLLNFNADQVAFVRSLTNLTNLIREIGIRTPFTTETFDQDRQRTYLIKCKNSTGGAHIRNFNSNTEIHADEYLQEHIAGTPFSASYLASKESCELLGVCQQFLGNHSWGCKKPFQFCGAIGPINLSHHVHSQLVRLGEAIHRTTNCRGLFGVDFVLNRNDIWIIEVNPRPTASMEILEKSLCNAPKSTIHQTTISLMQHHIQAFETAASKIPIYPINIAVWAKAILFHNKTQELRVCHRLASRLIRLARRGVISDVPRPGTTIANCEPICTVLANGQNPKSALQHLKIRLANIKNILANPR